MEKSILILEDDLSLAKSLFSEFEDHKYNVTVCNSIQKIPSSKFQFAVLDIRLNGEFGLNAIEIIKMTSPECKIVILTGYGSIATAVESVKRGAVDYLTKPTSFHILEEALLGNSAAPRSQFKIPSLSQIEHEYIDFILTKNRGNISKTARTLGLHRQSLQRKLKKYL